METRFSQLPKALAERTITTRLAAEITPFEDGGVPALLAHPDEGWNEPGASPSPKPVVIWMHGRTVSKELDPGRYLRWLRTGIATCAIDLPAHGDRLDEAKNGSEHTLSIVHQCANEIDMVIEALQEPRFNGAFDTDRIAIGGMSAGGMVALIRLCWEHNFSCATVEATAGNFREMMGRPFYIPEMVEQLNPMDHLETWRAIPFLALHTVADQWVPFAAMRTFIDAMRKHYMRMNAPKHDVEFVTWPSTGAEYEHMGFGRFANDAKNTQTAFLTEHLRP